MLNTVCIVSAFQDGRASVRDGAGKATWHVRNARQGAQTAYFFFRFLQSNKFIGRYPSCLCLEKSEVESKY